MNSKFTFLEGRFPRLAEFGQKAEYSLGKDNNICLLNLGRIAETITEILCRRNNITIEEISKAPDKLFEAGIIHVDTCLKIKTLIEIKEDAANHNYSSESAASRLITTALELCKWLMSDKGISRFAFLGDLFPENAPFPTLAVLAEYGSEAEENLFTNTRYSLLCLGDIEEAIVDILLNEERAKPHYGFDQDKRINLLYNIVGMDNKDKLDALHKIRQIRNDAVHSRYDSESETIQTLDETLKLCEWLFMFIISSGDFMRGVITEITPEGLKVSAGKIYGFVPVQEVPPDSADLTSAFTAGERRIFRVISKANNDTITLSLTQGLTDPWANMARHYERYSVGQTLNVRVKRTADNFGAFVDVDDSGELQARIPKSEYGSYANPPRARDALRTGDTLKACIQWVNPEHYPYMIMSIAEAEKQGYTGKTAPAPEETDIPEESAPDSQMTDTEFKQFCRKATHLEIIRALDSGANPNAANNQGTTALMEASQRNPDVKSVRELLDAGAEINAQNHHGNTALHYAAMQNTPEAVRLLCERGAETGILNEDGKKPLDYARSNPRLKNDTGILQLLAGDEEIQVLPAEHKAMAVSDRKFLDLCQHGKEQDIISAVRCGANVNAANKLRTTALMHAAKRSVSGAVRVLAENGADVNAVNKNGVTPLMMAVMNSRAENIDILLDNGASVLAANKKGKTLLEYAREKLTGKKCLGAMQRIEDAVKALPEPEQAALPESDQEELRKALKMTLQRDILKICRSGNLDDISQAIDAGVNLIVRNKNGAAPLMFAAKDNTAEAVDMLIKAGAEINAQDKSGNTALIYAAAYNSEDVIIVLLEAGADKDIRNNSGYRAYDYALRNYRLDDSDILEKLR
ncbi:MAG: ankyrin repeat domain-containing protein [Synergistaceae bacterium]|nr:ankyrin repeat domain-containing protein [Synergistaceae bacterium]